MNSLINMVIREDCQPTVVVGNKHYQFLTSLKDIPAPGFDGSVVPLLGTYVFNDCNQQAIAIIMLSLRDPPRLMDSSWNNIIKMLVSKPTFTRGEELGIGEGDLLEKTAILMDACRSAHQFWSQSYSQAQLQFDQKYSFVRLFDKTYHIGSDTVPEGFDGAVYYEQFHGFIFLDKQLNPLFALTHCANEKYFCSASRVSDRVISSFALNDSDVDKLGGELLFEVHRTKMAERLFGFLSSVCGVPV